MAKPISRRSAGPKDATQFEIAKKLDPNDPTPWFYDAIRKQTENRPVEALRDLEKAIELNDNRAVYRSRLLLDTDRAARGTSLANIYSDLGFEQLARIEAVRSLTSDHTNHSAHRFLSDSYSRSPRYEIARLSELLQAQLLQPVNINPIQSSRSFVDTRIADGNNALPLSASEYQSLFERNQIRLIASGTFGDGSGNKNTFSEEVNASAIADKLSFSLGQFHAQTDGFRENNDAEEDIFDAFIQIALNPQVSIQSEIIRRRADKGIQDINFDPDVFFPRDRRLIEEDIARFGLLYTPNTNLTFIFSSFYANITGENIFDDITSITRSKGKEEGVQIELQSIYKYNSNNFIIGGGALDTDLTSESDFINDEQSISSSNTSNRNIENAYAYLNFDLPHEFFLTLGMGYSSFRLRSLDIDESEYKIGLQWDLLTYLTLRAAYFETVNGPLITNQTIEPSEVAGFTQIFDDFEGTKSTVFGFGIDVKPKQNFFSGFELIRRDIDVPLGFGDSVQNENRNENLIHAYANLLLSTSWSLSLEAYYDIFKSDPFQFNFDLPERVSTFELPLSIRYFDDSGFFARFTTKYLNQTVKRREEASLPDGSDNALLFDASIGYKFRHRLGAIVFDVENIFDKEFFYQDDNFRSASTAIGIQRFIPDRRFLLRTTFKF